MCSRFLFLPISILGKLHINKLFISFWMAAALNWHTKSNDFSITSVEKISFFLWLEFHSNVRFLTTIILSVLYVLFSAFHWFLNWKDIQYLMWSLLGKDLLIQVTKFGWCHFQRGKISQGRCHKDYLDKSKIDSTRNPKRNSH